MALGSIRENILIQCVGNTFECMISFPFNTDLSEGFYAALLYAIKHAKILLHRAS